MIILLILAFMLQSLRVLVNTGRRTKVTKEMFSVFERTGLSLRW